MGHVGRTDVGGGKTGFPPEMPGLGMEAGKPGEDGWDQARISSMSLRLVGFWVKR